MKREKIVIILLVSLVCVLWIIQQEMMSSLYILKVGNSNTEKQLDSIKKNNQSLKLELLNKSSYRYIWKEAIQEGYQPAQFVYLR